MIFVPPRPVDDTHTVTVQQAPASANRSSVSLGNGASIKLGPNMTLPKSPVTNRVPSAPNTNNVNLSPAKGSVPQAEWNSVNNAVGAMKMSGRSQQFMKEHLGQEIAMQGPTLTPAKGSVPQSKWNAIDNAVGAMKISGRSEDFMKTHLGQEMAMQSPNWGLTPGQGAQARVMAESGRTQSFIRGKLGLPSSTYVPGKQG